MTPKNLPEHSHRKRNNIFLIILVAIILISIISLGANRYVIEPPSPIACVQICHPDGTCEERECLVTINKCSKEWWELPIWDTVKEKDIGECD